MPQELRKRHRGHARALKNIDERFERYADAIEWEPASCRGRWAQAHPVAGTDAESGSGTGRAAGTREAREVRLDLGCGKGRLTVESALAEPDVLYVGLDCERKCIALAAQLAIERGARNVIFTLADAEDVGDFFAPGELSSITLAFPTPHPRKKHAGERLTHVDALVGYRPLLAEGGHLDILTDSPMFFEWTLEELDMAAYEVVEKSVDLGAGAGGSGEGGDSEGAGSAGLGGGGSAEGSGRVRSEWEERLVAAGAKVHYVRARPAEGEVRREQQVPASLFDWLGDDLDELEYVPYGMGPAVEQFRAYKNKHGELPPKSG